MHVYMYMYMYMCVYMYVCIYIYIYMWAEYTIERAITLHRITSYRVISHHATL